MNPVFSLARVVATSPSSVNGSVRVSISVQDGGRVVVQGNSQAELEEAVASISKKLAFAHINLGLHTCMLSLFILSREGLTGSELVEAGIEFHEVEEGEY